MKAISIDFSTKRGPPRWAWFFAAAPFLAAALFGASAVEQRRELRAMEELRARASAEAARASALVAQEPPYAESVREYLRQAHVDWPTALRAIELARTDRVQVRSIELVPGARRVTVEVLYGDGTELAEFVDALNAGLPLPQWSLVKVALAQPDGAVRSLALVVGEIR